MGISPGSSVRFVGRAPNPLGAELTLPPDATAGAEAVADGDATAPETGEILASPEFINSGEGVVSDPVPVDPSEPLLPELVTPLGAPPSPAVLVEPLGPLVGED
jgi:hypothetical protein